MTDCTKTSHKKIIVFRDPRNSKCEMRFKNPTQKKISEVRVDGCKILSGKACDFMLLTGDTEHYIEIKGKDVPYACEQIEATIKQLSYNITHYPKNSFVVSTGTPNISGRIQILQKRFKKLYNSSLKIQTRRCEFTI